MSERPDPEAGTNRSAHELARQVRRLRADFTCGWAER